MAPAHPIRFPPPAPLTPGCVGGFAPRCPVRGEEDRTPAPLRPVPLGVSSPTSPARLLAAPGVFWDFVSGAAGVLRQPAPAGARPPAGGLLPLPAPQRPLPPIATCPPLALPSALRRILTAAGRRVSSTRPPLMEQRA